MGDFDHLRDWDPLDHMPVEDAVEQTLKDLAVNVMRISRGAGEAYNLARQIGACAKALRRYAEEKAQLPSSSEIKAMLNVRGHGGGHLTEERATADIVRASLRIAAAELQGNRLQRDAGERDLYRAIRWFNEERAERAAAHKR